MRKFLAILFVVLLVWTVLDSLGVFKTARDVIKSNPFHAVEKTLGK